MGLPRALGLVLALAVPACGGDDGGDDGGGDGIDVSSLSYRPCALDRHVGGFEIVLGDGFTGVQGQVRDGVIPSRVSETITTMGTCAWVRAPALVCDPGCAVGQTCAPGNTCIAQPVAQDVGTVEVDGLKVAVTMAPRAPAYFYTFTGALPHPGFDPGAGLRLRMGATQLLGWGIEALAGVPATLEVQRMAPIALTWTPPGQAGPARVEISLNVNGHGTVGSHVECVADDTGAFTIPEPLVTSLLDDGLSGFPTITLRRTTTDAADTAAGCVELDVHSTRTIDLTIPGLTSCDGDEDCTPPATCQPDLTCGP